MIDYAIAYVEAKVEIDRMEIDGKTESDHQPLTIHLNCKTNSSLSPEKIIRKTCPVWIIQGIENY